MSTGLILWSVAAVLLLVFVFGLGGLLHLALWVLVIVLVFGLMFAGVALIMRVIG
jgi:hypothetical protein